MTNQQQFFSFGWLFSLFKTSYKWIYLMNVHSSHLMILNLRMIYFYLWYFSSWKISKQMKNMIGYVAAYFGSWGMSWRKEHLSAPLQYNFLVILCGIEFWVFFVSFGLTIFPLSLAIDKLPDTKDHLLKCLNRNKIKNTGIFVCIQYGIKFKTYILISKIFYYFSTLDRVLHSRSWSLHFYLLLLKNSWELFNSPKLFLPLELLLTIVLCHFFQVILS